jgi:anthranilate synthase/aminodeoxychorismate synthase-like glutamine amidotransferase
MILMIDNYDSFTYNLVQYLLELGEEVQVFRNDAIDVRRVEKKRPRSIVISPGPGVPQDAGVCVELIRRLSGRIPILGVCLGHQAIGVAFGARIAPARRLMHGKVSKITHDGKTIYKGIENPFEATRYHSLVVDRKDLPSCLTITAVSEEGEIMGLRHAEFPVEGVQFHPESILTSCGKKVLGNFLAHYGRHSKAV